LDWGDGIIHTIHTTLLYYDKATLVPPPPPTFAPHTTWDSDTIGSYSHTVGSYRRSIVIINVQLWVTAKRKQDLKFQGVYTRKQQ
jgi:hypothetical protein